MVLSVKAAAGAKYYFQPWGNSVAPRSSGGVWLKAPEALGLSREEKRSDGTRYVSDKVRAAHLHRLLHRMTVHSGESPTFSRKKTSSGYDFVFSAPKSVSIIWALGSRDWRRAIEDAHEGAVKGAVDILAEHAIAERVGKGGQTLRHASAAIAAFFHYRCRPASHRELQDDDPVFADPNLHTHVVVPDIVVSVDLAKERGFKIAYTALYGRWSLALGAWYHAHLACSLRRLGLALEPVARGNGLFQVKGVSPQLITAFSARTQGAVRLARDVEFAKALEIDRADEIRPDRRAKHFEEALSRTKRAAQASDLEADERRWRALAAKLGLSGPLVESEPSQNAGAGVKSSLWASTLEHAEELIAALTDEKAVLQRPDFFRAVAARLVADGADQFPTAAMVNHLLQHADLVKLSPTDCYRFPRWTSKATLRDEDEVIRVAEHLSRQTFPVAEPQRFAPRALAWTDDQWHAICELAGANRIVAMTGVPGSGKTSLLKPVADAYRDRYPNAKVLAAAEAWKTALSLRPHCGGESYALAALFEKERHGRLEIGKDTLLIVDEVGLLATKRMLQLLRLVERTGAKLILIGDGDQLSPIGAGSGLDLVRKAVCPIVLTEIKRQENASQHRLVESLVAVAATPRGAAQGETVSAVNALAVKLAEAGAWASHQNSRAAIDEIAARVALWKPPVSAEAPVNAQAREAVALTRSHREAHAVNRAVRALLREREQLTGEDLRLKAVTPTGLSYPLRIAVGDHIRFLSHLRKHKLYNGSRGVIVGIDGRASIDVRVLDLPGERQSRVVTIAISELMGDDGRVRLACDYAATVFSSQGATYDEVILLRPKSMRFREFYVALTRARTAVRIVEVDYRRAMAAQKLDVGAVDEEAQRRLARSIALDLLESRRRDRAPVLATDASVSRRRNEPPQRESWFWDMLIVERNAA